MNTAADVLAGRADWGVDTADVLAFLAALDVQPTLFDGAPE